MQKDFYILGTFVNSESERETEEDLTPQLFNEFISTLDKGDELTIHVNSCGGNVNAGIAIANMIQALNEKGIMTTAIVEGIAASIASVVVCACQKVKMYESSFLMIHYCWSIVQGNSEELRKEADVMDKLNKAIIHFYHKKFGLTDEQLQDCMKAETWIGGNEISRYKFNAELLSEEHQYKIAASIKNKKFNNIPKDLIMEDNKEKEEEQKTAEVEETKPEVVKEAPEETKKEEEPEAPEETKPEVVKEAPEETKPEVVKEAPEETKPEVEAPEETKKEEEPEMIAKAECEKRVSGMQSTMAKKIDALNKEYNAKIEDFKNQLKAKDEELTKVNNLVTSLNAKLEDVSNELQKTASALEMKKDALAKLNAGVNSPSENVNWRDLKGKQFFDYIKAHPEVAKGNKQ